MIETHAFGDFVPPNAKYLLLGSFLAKKAETDLQYDWYYGSKRNQLWSILEGVYGIPLRDKAAKVKLFTDLGIAISDIIYQCERKHDNSLDSNLINIVYNVEGITKILRENRIEKIFFSSRFVENNFRRVFKDLIAEFPDVQLVTLPSPSPRFAKLSLQQKMEKYREILPKL